ncbi:homeobox-domain-containing protein [Conidiobolus coronatus NRRL 28638]|uniref:Homeobox-domain-containing protein n=1 Tax=Conidiobolus coronatus (strain ATCC 28846 / CBS 209.66 / NRRL 28638) TaxID=796925 RepID=A0A137NSZ5_CONC2|nr:homeobox-domain-containing protein [Conidiobolus coronatus NRRL 28638]|eukprot:KXN65856.1 homeobox-domain-containing protein [Conidiobolus coronatus NRRL 28638]
MPSQINNDSIKTRFYNPHFTRSRTRLSDYQTALLEQMYLTTNNPQLSTRKQLSQQLGMSPRTIQVWFQNRRAKERTLQTTTHSSASSTPASTCSSALHSEDNCYDLPSSDSNSSQRVSEFWKTTMSIVRYLPESRPSSP